MSIEVLTNGCGVSKEYKDSFANVDITSTSSSQISVTFNTLPEYISSMRFETVEMTNSSTANWVWWLWILVHLISICADCKVRHMLITNKK